MTVKAIEQAAHRGGHPSCRVEGRARERPDVRDVGGPRGRRRGGWAPKMFPRLSLRVRKPASQQLNSSHRHCSHRPLPSCGRHRQPEKKSLLTTEPRQRAGGVCGSARAPERWQGGMQNRLVYVAVASLICSSMHRRETLLCFERTLRKEEERGPRHRFENPVLRVGLWVWDFGGVGHYSTTHLTHISIDSGCPRRARRG